MQVFKKKLTEHSWKKKSAKKGGTDGDSKNDINSYNITIKNFKKNCITFYLIGAEVTVKIHERLLLSCFAFSDPENVQHIGCFRCSTDDC